MRILYWILLAAALLPLQGASAADSRPNIVIIFLDDIGFGDLGSFGSDIETPHLDRLARKGLRYTNFTATGVCSPSRAALLTGLNHHSAGVGFASDLRREDPGYRGMIHPHVATLPEVLRDHGYATLMVGKWHLVNMIERVREGPYDNWPTGRGFDRFFGFLESHTSQWMPTELYDGTTPINVPNDGSFYLPDAITDEAISMLEEHDASESDQPFLLYYSTSAGHAPHHTKAQDRAKYAGRYEAGYDQARKERLARQIEMGLLPAATPLAPYYPGVVPWQELSLEERLVSAKLQENYAAFVDNLDQNIGRLIAHLEDTDKLDNTLILVASDNGASREAFINGTTNQARYFTQAGETHEERLREIETVGEKDSYPNYPMGWMQVSNTPFKLSKASVHGGGVRVPLIVQWPGRIEDPGGIRRQFHHVNDVMPTLLEWLEIPHPTAEENREFKPIEGVSFAYTLSNPFARTRKLEQYYEMEGNRAYVNRGWKLVSWHPDGEPHEDYPWELYDLVRDPSESRNLARRMPEKVAELAADFDAAAKRFDVYPIDDRFLIERADFRMDGPRNYRYEPGGATIPFHQAPLLVMRSYAINARLKREAGDGGVLVALGDIYSGYSLFIQNDHVHFVVNRFGEETHIRSESPIPVGNVEVALRFEKDGFLSAILRGGLSDRFRFLGGTATLLVDGKPVGEARLPFGPSLLTWEGLDIGLDRRSPVTHAYAPPFAFEGNLIEVQYDLGDPPFAMRGEMGEMVSKLLR